MILCSDNIPTYNPQILKLWEKHGTFNYVKINKKKKPP